MRTSWVACCLAAIALLAVPARAVLRLPALFSDHLVLQSARATPCWGWADPGELIDLQFADAKTGRTFSVHTAADTSGRWQAALPAMPQNLHGTLTIRAGKEERVLNDVMTGEVWLASGQSNMTYRVGAPDFPPHVSELAKREAAAVSSRIRVFTVLQEGVDEPRGDVRGQWVVVDPGNVDKISALPWNFAHALHRELALPVGVIVSGHGGTPVESWLPRETLDATPVAAKVWKRHHDLVARYPDAKAAYDKALADWEQANPTPELQKQNVSRKPRVPYSATSSKAPARLYNAMIDGLVPYAVQGVIWYQGEENTGRSGEYGPLVRALVGSWRERWGEPLPFYYVELANSRPAQKQPSEGGWALLREAQSAVLDLPRTGVVTAVDVGDGSIHPWNKKAVGERLAALVLAEVHHRTGPEVRSPEYVSHKIVGTEIHIHTRYASRLRVRGDDGAQGFSIRGADGVWHWADARVQNDRIIVSHPEVTKPVAVRYGWASNPRLSIENESGLPLRPFRTDPEAP